MLNLTITFIVVFSLAVLLLKACRYYQYKANRPMAVKFAPKVYAPADSFPTIKRG